MVRYRISCAIFNTILLCTFIVSALETNQKYDGIFRYISNNQVDKQPNMDIDWNCSLIPEFSDQRVHIATLTNDGSKLVKVRVKTVGGQDQQNWTYAESKYSSHSWVLATSVTGKSMLMLKEYFDAMSLGSLGFGVAKADIALMQEPKNCLKGANSDYIENKVREQFLRNFNAESNTLPEGTEICNTQVVNETKYDGRLAYVCCRLNLTGQLLCAEIKESAWLKILFFLILILQIILILFSPMFLPSAMYKTKTVFEKFIFETEPEEILKFNAKTTREGQPLDRGFIKGKLQSFTDFSSLKGHIGSMETGKIYTIYLNKIDLKVRFSKLVSIGNSPINILNFLRGFFVRCKIREEVQVLGKCCDENMCIRISKTCVWPWYRCLQFFMGVVVIGLITLPWTLRVLFYYMIEEEPIQHMRKVLADRNLSAPYTGNLVSYWTPIHPFFLAIYGVIGLQILMYAFMKDTVKRKIKYTVRRCLQDMRDTDRIGAFATVFSHLLLPLRKLGILGLLIFPIWLLIIPICLLLLSVELFPILNLSVRFLVNFLHRVAKTFKLDFMYSDKLLTGVKVKSWFWKRVTPLLVVDHSEDKEENSRWYQILYAVCIIFTFLSMLLSLVLVFECISFYVECAVYTLVGFILNPGDTMKYVSLLLLIAVYAIECFSSVSNAYCDFSKGINSEVQAMVGPSMEEEAAKEDHEQENAAFRVTSKTKRPERLKFVLGSEMYIKLNLPRLVMFLDKSDVPYIPKAFLFQMARLPHHLCPGPPHLLYLKAFSDFLIIIIFLFFVFVVIFAFGQAQDISSGAQAIVALGSGFLPLILRKFLFQSHSSSGFDNSNLKWKHMFANRVQEYVARWNFQDFYITEKHEAVLGDINSDSGVGENDLELYSVVDLIIQLNRNGTYTYYVPDLHQTEYRISEVEKETML